MTDFSQSTAPNAFTFWTGFGWSAMIVIAFFSAQLFVGMVYGIYVAITSPELIKNGEIALSGNFLAMLVLLSGAVGLLALTLISRNQGLTFDQELRLTKPKIHQLFGYSVLGILCSALGIVFFQSINWTPEPDMLDMMIDGASNPLTWISVVIMAPIFEEVLFRGYCYRVLYKTRAGVIGTLLIGNSIWMLLHAGQYDWLGMTFLFIVGLVFGFARWKTNNLVIPIAMHMVFNATSMTSTYFTYG